MTILQHNTNISWKVCSRLVLSHDKSSTLPLGYNKDFSDINVWCLVVCLAYRMDSRYKVLLSNSGYNGGGGSSFYYLRQCFLCAFSSYVVIFIVQHLSVSFSFCTLSYGYRKLKIYCKFVFISRNFPEVSQDSEI